MLCSARNSWLTFLAITLATVATCLRSAPAQVLMNELPKEAKDLEIVPHLGEKLPMHVEFKNSKGEPVKLGDYFKDGKPVIIVMAYYRCPVMCPVTIDKMAKAMDEIDYLVGDKYKALVFSIDPTEVPLSAENKKYRYVSGYAKLTEANRATVESGFEFHVGTQVASKELADALGFRYKLLENGEYSHPSLMFVVTPDGRLARYAGGISYTGRDLKLMLLEASQGKIADGIGDLFMHYCYRFDPNSGKYVLVAWRVMQIGGIITMISIATLIGLLFAGERVRRRARLAALTTANQPPPPSSTPPPPPPSTQVVTN
jgi:protein SCO1/2